MVQLESAQARPRQPQMGPGPMVMALVQQLTLAQAAQQLAPQAQH